MTYVDKRQVIVHTDGAQVTCAPSHPIVISGAVVFGGQYRCQPGDLVPVAPPGARLSTGQRMRTRRYRGQRSEGMLCSTNELGWTTEGPDEVHVLHDLHPGHPLHTGGTA